MSEGGERPRPPIIKPGRDADGTLIKREGFPKPSIGPEDYASPYRKGDGRLVRIDDPNRPPTRMTRLKHAFTEKYHAAGDRIQHTPLGKFATWLTAWREPTKPSGHPAGEFVRPSDIRRAGEVVDLHGPIDDPNTLSPDDAHERQMAKGRHPSTLGEVLADDPNARENARIEEIAGRTHPGTDAPFVDVPEKPYRWDDDHDIAVTTTPVTELAGAGTYQEVVEARQLGEQGREGAQAQPGLRLVVDNDPKKGRKPTPPDDSGGGTAA